jgi:hypothetical protein
MSSPWAAVFIQVLDRTGPLMLNLSGTPDIKHGKVEIKEAISQKLDKARDEGLAKRNRKCLVEPLIHHRLCCVAPQQMLL